LNTISFLVWLLPLFSVPLVPLVGYVRESWAKWFAVLVSGLTALFGLYQIQTFGTALSESATTWVPFLNVTLEVKIDGLSVILSAFVSCLSFIIILYSAGYMKHDKAHVRFYSLILLFVGGMLGLVMAGNIVQLYFFWEIVGICSALLIAHEGERPEARQAGFKAFIVTRFGDASLLVAVILMLITFHTGSLDGIISSLNQVPSTTTLAIGALILVGAMAKSAQVPFHVWLPDAMEGPTPVSALIHAATMVNAGVYLVARMFPVFQTSSVLLTAVLGVGLASMVLGALCASTSEDLKRILAYSTISQLGLMFVGLGLGNWSSAIYHLISQGLFKALAFMAAGSVITAIGTRDIESMGGLRRKMRYSYVAFLFASLAMVGLPPLVGFWTKDQILGLASGNLFASSLVVLASVATAFYSFRALIKVFHGSGSVEAKESPPVMTIPMMLLVVSVIGGVVLFTNQSLIPTLRISELTLYPVLASLGALATGFGIAYVAFSSRVGATRAWFQSSGFLIWSRRVLLEGLGFDRFYVFLYRSLFRPLIRGLSEIQTGILGSNLGLLLATLVLLIVLIATGVI
jgi:NADH-quinone oxidoreductase subunit L